MRGLRCKARLGASAVQGRVSPCSTHSPLFSLMREARNETPDSDPLLFKGRVSPFATRPKWMLSVGLTVQLSLMRGARGEVRSVGVERRLHSGRYRGRRLHLVPITSSPV
eukprot:scaffold21070_cov107-Isochrysis_galbana.AAC.6